MKTYLFLDVETTGFKKSGNLIQEGQGRVCQIAMILAREDGRILSEFSSLIKPDGWTIGAGAQKVHGISQEDCEEYGLSIDGIMNVFEIMVDKSTQRVAHNEAFDRGMMDVEVAYYTQNYLGDDSIYLEPQKPWFCTMKSNVHINNGRWPKLAQAYKHYTGKELSGAHDAMVDTRACMEIFFAMRGVKI